MKRLTLLKHLTKQGCFLVREGKKHSIFYNPSADRTSTIPRHSEIHDFLAEKICKDLSVTSVKHRH